MRFEPEQRVSVSSLPCPSFNLATKHCSQSIHPSIHPSIMVSAFLTGIAGAILAPILPQFALNKLLDSLFEYLSKDQPSSSSHSDKLQQLDNERKAFAMAHRKLEILQSEVRRLHKRENQNMRLIDINNDLRDVSCQIKDLKDDLEYTELQRKVEEINLQDEAADKNPSTALQLLSSINPWKTGGSSDKRRRLSSSESTDDIVNKMRTIVKQIDCIDSEMRFEIQLDASRGGYNSCGQHQVAENKRVTTSSPTESKIYGRDNERSRLIQVLLKEPNVSGNVSVVPVVGMGGIGKTTLAQFVFNNKEIANHFEKKAWICVSDYFDRFRITKEILDSLSIGDGSSSAVPFGVTTNLDVLEREIKSLVTGKKFLLVLDDVWSDEWRALLNFLRWAEAEAIKLIVTCRDPKVLGGLADGQNQITLKGLSDEDNWSLLVKCAFADKNHDNYPELHAIGKKMVGKLKGSPLAAKTVGRLLGSCLTEEHWKNILESHLWKLKTDEQGIMPALALSYDHLRQPLQLCFTFCSVFPKDFEYDMNSVIGMWIAHGYIQEIEIEGNSKTLEDIGEEYWLELEARGFIEKVYGSFKMHDLLHDLARSVCDGETYIYEGRKDDEIPKDVCHLCVHGFFDVELVRKTNNLRTLILYEAGDLHAILSHKAFERIRVLVIHHTNVQELPENIAHLKHLQYLDLGETSIESMPESLCTMYLLRVLKLSRPPHKLPSRFHNLINLRRFYFSYYSFWGDLQTSYYVEYHVNREGGYQIAQLRNMNELRGELLIRGLENIGNVEEVMKAKYLKEKRHIKVLSLLWEDTFNDCKHDLQEQTLEALEPDFNLKYLRIDGYMGFKSPNWLMTPEFQRLEKIKLNGCRKWARLPAALGLLPSLKSLELSGIENITIEVDYSLTEMYPSLQSLELIESTLYFEGLSSSSSATGQNHNHFPKLTSLIIKEIEVNGLHLPLFSALRKLEIKNSRVVFDQLEGCLNGVSSLSDLVLHRAIIQTFPAKVMATLHALVKLNIFNCNELISLEVLQALSSLEQLSIVGCSKFISWGTEKEMTALPNLQYMIIDSCKDLETLPAWLPRLPLLKKLKIRLCPKLISWGTEEEMTALPNLQYMSIYSCKDLETLPAWLPRLPLLNRLIIDECPKFRSWGMEEEIPKDGFPLPNLQKMEINCCNGLETLPAWLPRLPLLNRLEIIKCPKLISWGTEEAMTALPNLQYMLICSCEDLETLPAWLPHLPLLNTLIIKECPKFRLWGMEEEEITEDGFPLPNLQEMKIKCCDDLETLPVWLPHLPLLKRLKIIKCPKLISWGMKEEMTALPNLQYMKIDSCEDLETLPAWLPHLPLLNTLEILECPKLISWGTEEEMTALPNLEYMYIFSCEVLETLPAWLPHLPLLNTLIISVCPKFISWGTEEEMAALPNLQHMSIYSCKDLETLPAWLPRHPLLNRLEIVECPKLISWGTEKEMTTLPNLQYMSIYSCEDLETLPAWLHRLPILKELSVTECPKVHSLPKGGLPKSVRMLQLVECDPSLMERCQQEGSLEWQMIQHIPHRKYTW
ncbi:P-loop containing nucleoside triphosphate hydrolase protein [Dioscorea alata]|uniref:P-loop containing nucleoside triphosphate hydrolase protein n=2 Tax=Dioscorea alata TaxID=55571 RepID=A0ACB7U8U6_DIOAL|nr:P-loop containing nucleoside triphosphate hydrolase protein [Dioscorea alata]KAH7656708.1 P-loop containing nucleoside triphosphate hydrolase protein [Dioscorea alata]